MLFAEIPAGCDQTIAKLCLKPRFIDNQNDYKIIQARFTALVVLIAAQGDKVAVEIDFSFNYRLLHLVARCSRPGGAA